MTKAVLGIDIGTSTTKIVVLTSGGRILAERSTKRGTVATKRGWQEQKPELDWWGYTAEIIKPLLRSTGVEITGVGVTGCGPNVAAVDQDFQCLGETLLYNDDRATEQLAQLESQYGDAQIQQLCGHSLNAESVGPKLLWLQSQRSEIWERTKEIHTSHSFVVRRLGGDYVLDHTTASLWDPLYNPWSQSWNREVAEELGLLSILPTLVWPSDVVGRVSAEAEKVTGIPSGAAIIAGTIDFAAELVGTGIEEPGRASIVYGSTMVVQALTTDVVVGREIYSCVGPQKGTHLVGGVTASAGSLMTWWGDIIGESSSEDIAERAATSPVGSRGIVTLPYFVGERSPIFDPQARGVVAGLTLKHDTADIYRSAMESSAYALRHVIETIASRGIHFTEAIATGGGAAGVWARIVTDCTRITQIVPAMTAAASLGVAILAARATYLMDSSHLPLRSTLTLQPDELTAARYDDLYHLYRELDSVTRPIVHELSRLSRAWANNETRN